MYVVVHATCYERATKLLGLKVGCLLELSVLCNILNHVSVFTQAANAYWNFEYYDPRRPTITKVRYMLGSTDADDDPGVCSL